MSWIITGTGASRFSFLEPSARDIAPQDIIASLSRTARFRGMGLYYFSVAQHSILVGYLMIINAGIYTLEDLTAGRAKLDQGDWGYRLMQVALLHDAPETYMADLASPLKAILPSYRAVESRVAPLCYGRFGVTPTDNDLMLLHQADVQAGLMERDLLFPDNLKNWETEDMHPGRKVEDFFHAAWTPDQAAPAFATMFAHYFPEVTGHVH